jgi:superoxide dismutase, Cu-Zn family
MPSQLPTRTLVALVLAGALAGCAETVPDLTATPPPGTTPWIISSSAARSGDVRPSSSEQAPLTEGTVTGTFLPYPESTRAITYDPKVVPPGATVQVSVSMTTQGARVRLAASGMVPRRAYGAHLHTKACTATPDQAGPHYQHTPDPKAATSPPSVDPAYANPRNEVWLDFTADTQGSATATASEDWRFDETRPPRSLIVHAEQTRTTAGKAGTAGPRVACLTLATP